MEKPPAEPSEIKLMDYNESDHSSVAPKESKIVQRLKSCLNPPTYALLISMPLALIPYVRKYVFVGSSAVLDKNVFAAILSMGAPTTALIMIILGCNLSRGYPPGCDISK